MKKFLFLLACTYTAIHCNAQQKELDSLLNELKKHPQEDTVRLKILLGVAHSYSRVDGNKGLFIAQQTIAMAKELHNINLEGTAYNYAAQNCQTLGNDSLAIAYCLLSLKIKEKLKDSIGTAVSFHTMAISFFDQSNYTEALKNEVKAEEIFKHQKDTFRLAASINSLGIDYKYLGNYPEALKDFQQSMYLWSKTGNTSYTANPLTNTGLIYSTLHNYMLALDYYNKALALQQSAGNMTGIVNDYENIANAYDDMQDTLRARIYYRKDLQFSQKSNYAFGIASAMGNLGISFLNNKELDEAIYYLQPALKKFTDLHDDRNEAYIIDNLCSAYLHAPDAMLKKYNIPITNKYKYVLRLQQQSILLAKKTKSVTELQNAYESLSNIYEAKKDYKQALMAHKQYVMYKDSLINDTTKQQITRLEMQYQFNKTQDSSKAITDKQQALAKAEIQQQRITKNATMAGAGFLLLAGISGFVFYKRNRDIRTQKNEAELKSQVAETEMKALRAQMNPHFIFNSLNSISDFVIKNNTQAADYYLTKFARLMRLILENSEKKEISLADDLTVLELYMQLEAMRMDNKFTYEIKVDDDIDTNNTLIPPLILQPLIENSFKHGLPKKKGEGKIIIHIQQENNMLLCTVEDNGIGRKEAGIRKEQAEEKERKSFGIKIINDRINIINKIKNTNAAISMFDLPEGTKAEVKLPLELSF